MGALPGPAQSRAARGQPGGLRQAARLRATSARAVMLPCAASMRCCKAVTRVRGTGLAGGAEQLPAASKFDGALRRARLGSALRPRTGRSTPRQQLCHGSACSAFTATAGSRICMSSRQRERRHAMLGEAGRVRAPIGWAHWLWTACCSDPAASARPAGVADPSSGFSGFSGHRPPRGRGRPLRLGGRLLQAARLALKSLACKIHPRFAEWLPAAALVRRRRAVRRGSGGI